MTELSDKACRDLQIEFENQDFPVVQWQYLTTSEGKPWLFGITQERDMASARTIASRYADFLARSRTENHRALIEHPEEMQQIGSLPIITAFGERNDVDVTVLAVVTGSLPRDAARLAP